MVSSSQSKLLKVKIGDDAEFEEYECVRLNGNRKQQQILQDVRKQLRMESDLKRTCEMLMKYRKANEYQKIDRLTEKWRDVLEGVITVFYKEYQTCNENIHKEEFKEMLRLNGLL